MELTSDSVVVITGVSKGIGKACVEAFLKAGAKVAGLGRMKPDIQNPNFYFYQTDIRKMDEVQLAFTNLMRQLGGRIDVLINNAGLGFPGNIENAIIEQWHLMFDTNVHGLFYCTRLAAPIMKQQSRGHIFNIASIAGQAGIEGLSGYCATKHAVKGISHSIYKELRPHGVKVTCIYPGSVETNFFDSFSMVEANNSMMQPSDVAGTILNITQTSDNYHVVDVEMRPLQPKK